MFLTFNCVFTINCDTVEHLKDSRQLTDCDCCPCTMPTNSNDEINENSSDGMLIL